MRPRKSTFITQFGQYRIRHINLLTLTAYGSLLTTEIITEFAFAHSANLIEEKNDEFNSWFLDAFDVGSRSIVDLQYNSVLRNIVSVLPANVVKILNPQLRSILDLQQVYH